MVWNYQNYSYFKSRIGFSLYYIWQHAVLKSKTNKESPESRWRNDKIFFQTPSKERVVSCVMEEGGGQWICVIYKLCSLCVTGIGLASVWDESISIQQYFEWGHECGLEGTVESEWSLVSVSDASISFSWIRVSKVTHVRMSRSLMGSRRGSFRYHGTNHNQIHCCLVQRPFNCWKSSGYILPYEPHFCSMHGLGLWAFSDWNNVCFKLKSACFVSRTF